MSVLKKITSLFSSESSERDKDALWLYVRCDRCGEKIKTRIDLLRDLTPRYGEDGDVKSYFLRKVLVGSQGCFQPIEVRLTFDARRNVLSQEITGGHFITEEEYEKTESCW